MKKTVIAAALGALLLATGTALAKEGGDQYPNGAENWFAGAVPPPGFYFINYAGYYTGKLKDGSGNNISAFNTPKVDAAFDALRLLQTTNVKIFGANWGWHVILPLVHQNIDFQPLGGGKSKFGLGDITVNPMVLSWHLSPEWHLAAAFDINLPTGSYDKNDPRTSIGANYYSFEPIFAVSYLGSNGWEASAKFMYNIKTKNKDTNYQSGDEFHIDYLVGKSFGAWGIGLSGYYLQQVSNDKVNGQTVAAVPGLFSEGRKGQVFAIGPSIKYSAKNGMHFIGQWQHETKVKNRFGGDKLWFKLIMPL